MAFAAAAKFQQGCARIALNPVEVVQRMVELVEADETTENNFVPPGIIEAMTAQLEEG